MRFTQALLFTVTATLAAVTPTLAEEGDSPQVSVTALPAPLHLVQGKGGNVVASVGDDGVLIIDDDYTEYAPVYDSALDKLAGVEGTPKFVVNVFNVASSNPMPSWASGV